MLAATGRASLPAYGRLVGNIVPAATGSKLGLSWLPTESTPIERCSKLRECPYPADLSASTGNMREALSAG